MQGIDLLDNDGLVSLVLTFTAIIAADLFGECGWVVLESFDNEWRGEHLQEDDYEQQPQCDFEV